jgi:hypothetical protein
MNLGGNAMPDKTQEPVSLSHPPAINGVPNRPDDEIVNEEEEELARQGLARIMPSKERLRELAKKYPPPPEYFEGDEEMPFIPIEE